MCSVSWNTPRVNMLPKLSLVKKEVYRSYLIFRHKMCIDLAYG